VSEAARGAEEDQGGQIRGRRGFRLRLMRRITRRPARIVVVVLVSAILFGFGFNALVLQVGPHPAPLFADRSPEPTGPIPQPPVRSAAQNPPASASGQGTGMSAPTAVPLPPSDPIAGLIRQSGGIEPVREVLFVQRALTKLGYGPLKPDGIYGSGTRLAIEKWERDRGRPVRGEITRTLMQDLASASGLSTE
jgi:hypothetical protein